jgi:hypothetical protein
MKRVDLVRKITALGAVLERHGAKHDWYIKMLVKLFHVTMKLKKVLPNI